VPTGFRIELIGLKIPPGAGPDKMPPEPKKLVGDVVPPPKLLVGRNGNGGSGIGGAKDIGEPVVVRALPTLLGGVEPLPELEPPAKYITATIIKITAITKPIINQSFLLPPVDAFLTGILSS